jgi:hypothetical protein
MDTKTSAERHDSSITASPPNATSVHVSSTLHILNSPAENRLLRKCDLRLIPILCWLYLLLFTDRVNIGNVRVIGLEASLHMHGSNYASALCILLVSQIVFAVPSNLAMKHVRPSTWLSGLCATWGEYSPSTLWVQSPCELTQAQGLITLGTGFVKTYGQLLACRFLLGVCEGGFQTGQIMLFSLT